MAGAGHAGFRDSPEPAEHRARSLGVGPLRVELASDDREVVERFDHLLAAFGPAPADAGTIAINVRTRQERSDTTYETSVNGELLHTGRDLAEHELLVTRALNKHRLDAEPRLLHLHSGAVARDQRAVLLPGPPGSGKSTLTAALVQDGWAYLTDEQSAVRPDDGRVLSYPRPITLRQSSWAAFAHVRGVPRDLPPIGARSRIEVAPQDLGSVHRGDPLAVGTIVFPRFLGDRGAGLRRIATAAETVERLAASAHDLERLGGRGVATLAHLAARCAAWQLAFGDLSVAVRRVERAVAGARRRPELSVRHLAPTAVVPTGPGTVARAPEAEAWAFSDGSTVAYHPPTRALARLDGPGTELWEALGVACPMPQGRDADDERAAWIDAMLEAGLLVTGP